MDPFKKSALLPFWVSKIEMNNNLQTKKLESFLGGFVVFKKSLMPKMVIHKKKILKLRLNYLSFELACLYQYI